MVEYITISSLFHIFRYYMGVALIIIVIVLTITLQPALRSIKKIFQKKDPTLNSAYQFEDFVCNDVFIPEEYQVLHLLNKPSTIITACIVKPI